MVEADFSSGHGASVEDVDGDEHDDSDEAICPLDYKEAGMIIDDERESSSKTNTDRQCKTWLPIALTSVTTSSSSLSSPVFVCWPSLTRATGAYPS